MSRTDRRRLSFATALRVRARSAAVAAAAVLLAGSVGGCDVGASDGSGDAGGVRRRTPLSEIQALAAPAAPYQVVPVTNGGQLRGTVTFTGDAPRDTVVRLTSDEQVCGSELTDTTFAGQDGRVGQAVVWLAGIRAGKPRPLERRYELAHRGCRFAPRVQAGLVGGTLNLRAGDRLVTHRSRFVRYAPGRPTLAVAETNDDGQVVPLEQPLASPGLVEIRCDAHPWTRGWLFAFDHPYFAVTAPDGSFTLDSVPPGRYAVVAWHERLGVVRREVTVNGGGTTGVELEMRAKK